MYYSKHFKDVVKIAKTKLKELVEMLPEEDKKTFYEYYPAGVDQIPDNYLDATFFQVELKLGLH